MTRKRVYVSGPLSSQGDWEHNIKVAVAAGRRLMRAGLAVWIPHLTGRMEGHESFSHEEWIENDLPWVAVSDALLRLPGKSPGADQETQHAEWNDVPVYHDEAELIAALRPQPEPFAPLAICGPAGCGKTTAKAWFLEHTAAKGHYSTSEYYWCYHLGLSQVDLDEVKGISDGRDMLAAGIDSLNREDAKALYGEMYADGYTIFDGIRRKRELAACLAAGIVQRVLWIERTDVECSDPTCEITREDCAAWIDNDGTPEGLDRELQKFCEYFRIPILSPEAPPAQYED